MTINLEIFLRLMLFDPVPFLTNATWDKGIFQRHEYQLIYYSLSVNSVVLLVLSKRVNQKLSISLKSEKRLYYLK
jgi:hypothetical protein